MSQTKPPRFGVFAEPKEIDLTRIDALHGATQYNQAETVLNLLNQGTNVDQLSPEGWTALEVAALYGRTSIAKILLSHGANPDHVLEGIVPLHQAAKQGHADVLLLLLKHTANVNVKTPSGDNALHLAAENGREDIIRILAENLVNLEEPTGWRAYTPLHVACGQGHSQCVAELLSAGANPNSVSEHGVTPLMAAAVSDHAPTATILLDSGAEIDRQAYNGITAVSLAAFNGSASVLEVLISRGAVLDKMDDTGFDALRGAISANNVKTALLLLQQPYPVQIHYDDHQQTALHLAVSGNQYEVVKALLDKGADTEACDKDGDTALQYAVEGDQIQMVGILLRSGARINKQNGKTGETVLHWAVTCGLTNMTQALLAHESDPSLVDLSILQKKAHRLGQEEVEDDDFETCKILVETASLTERDVRPAKQFEWPPMQDGPVDGENLLEATPPPPVKSKSLRSTTNPIREMEDQVAIAPLVSRFQDKVVHKNVKCAGPFCTLQSDELCGIRYRCTCCDELNLCSMCIGSDVGNHTYRHPMIKCYLPSQFHAVYEVDEHSKTNFVLADPDSSGDPRDVSHIMYAITDQQALRQLQASLHEDLKVELSQITLLLGDPTMFAVYKKPLAPDMITAAPQTSLSATEATKVEDPERVIHNQDRAHLARVVFGSVKRFDYLQDETFYTWAKEGRIVTRLVDLKPGAFDDILEIELRVVDIEQEPIYEALSYTWKETAYERSLGKGRTKEEDLKMRQNAKIRHAVYCQNVAGDEVFWTINTGLKDALLRLRDPYKIKTLWIDQLCINQRSLSERAYQVRRMPTFYNRAQRVIVWTGDEDEHTRTVFEFYEKIARIRREIKRIPTLVEFMHLAAITTIDQPTFKALFDFFHRPVFGRSWCIQEIVVGAKVTVRCGTCEIDWADLGSAAMVLVSGRWEMSPNEHPVGIESKPPLTRKTDIPGVESWVTDMHGTILEAVGIDELRRMFRFEEETPLERLLYTTSRFQTSEVKDKVYSVLGIRGRNLGFRPKDGIIPNYEISDAEAFINTTQFCITQSESMHICGMMVSVSTKRVVGLPSWVPDYTTNDLCSGLSFCRPSPKIPYNACGDVPSIAHWPYEKQQNILVTSSCHVGTVTAYSQHTMSAEEDFPVIIADWTNLIDNLPRYPTGQRVLDVFVLTCFADSATVYRYRPHPHAQAFADTVKLIIAKSCLEYLQEHRSRPDQTLSKIVDSRTAGKIMEEAFLQFARIVNISVEDVEDATLEDQTSDQTISEAYSHMNISGDRPPYPEEPSTDLENATAINDDPAVSTETSPVKPQDKGKGRAVDFSPPIQPRDKGKGRAVDTSPPIQPRDKGKGRAVDTSPSIQPRVLVDEEAPSSEMNAEMERSADKAVLGACRDRRLFVTSDGYFGLGPLDIQSGDEVHVLSGTQVPFVLRKITADNAVVNNVDSAMIGIAAEDGLEMYRMIGECFVHGFMDGEAVDRDDLEWEGIAIC